MFTMPMFSKIIGFVHRSTFSGMLSSESKQRFLWRYNKEILVVEMRNVYHYWLFYENGYFHTKHFGRETIFDTTVMEIIFWLLRVDLWRQPTRRRADKERYREHDTVDDVKRDDMPIKFNQLSFLNRLFLQNIPSRSHHCFFTIVARKPNKNISWN